MSIWGAEAQFNFLNIHPEIMSVHVDVCVHEDENDVAME